MIRDLFEQLVANYPRGAQLREPRTDSPLADLVEDRLPRALEQLPNAKHLLIEGSIGRGAWTFTPWVALLDPAVTDSVQDHYYIVYLLSRNCERLYLSLNQGCTTLKNNVGIPKARAELERRALLMRSRLAGKAQRLGLIEMDLEVPRSIWRGDLYEHGVILGVSYDTASLPDEAEMIADVTEAIELYKTLKIEGGQEADDSIIAEVEGDDVFHDAPLEQIKRYRLHRRIERDASHSAKVKRVQGTRCKGCNLQMAEVYGEQAEGIIHAHHLYPLSSLDDDEMVRYDPRKDFAVLCPNCHAVIHKLENPADLKQLRTLVDAGALKSVPRDKRRRRP